MMMRYTSLMDALNASSHFTQNTLGAMDEVNRREAEPWLRNVQAKYATDIQNHLRDNPYNYTGDPNDKEALEAYSREYYDELHTFTRNWYPREMGSKANIPFYFRNVQQMQDQSLEGLRDVVLKKQDEWRIGQENVSFGEDRQRYREAVHKGDMTPQEAIEASRNRLDLSATIQEISPQQRNEILRADEINIHQTYLTDRINEVNDPSRLREVLNAARREFDFMPSASVNTYDEEGNITGTEEKPWGYEGRAEWEEALLQRRCFDIFRDRQAEFEGMVIAGEFDKAIRFGKAWGAYLDKHRDQDEPEFENLNAEYRDRTSHYFNWRNVEALLRQGRSGGGAGRRITAAAVSGKLKELLDEVLAGEGGDIGSIHEFNQVFKGMLYEWAYNLGEYGDTQERFEADYAGVLQQFWNFAEKAVQNSPEASSAITMTENYFNSLKTNSNARFMGERYRGVTAHARGEIMSGLYDAVYEYDNRTPERSGQDFSNRVKEMLGVVTGNSISALERSVSGNDNNLIGMVEALENRDIMHTDNLNRLVVMPGPANDPDRTRRQVERAHNELGMRIAEFKGLDPELLVAHNREDARGFEIDAAPEFQYNNGADWYRFIVRGEGRNKQLVLQHRRGVDGRWDGGQVVDRRAEIRAGRQEFTQARDEHNDRFVEENERNNRALSVLSNTTRLPMPPEFRGDTTDITARQIFIQRYGLDRYRQFLTDRGELPEEFR